MLQGLGISIMFALAMSPCTGARCAPLLLALCKYDLITADSRAAAELEWLVCFGDLAMRNGGVNIGVVAVQTNNENECRRIVAEFLAAQCMHAAGG